MQSIFLLLLTNIFIFFFFFFFSSRRRHTRLQGDWSSDVCSSDLTATDVAGNTATQTATFSVLYNFTGFLPPIPNDGSGVFKLGSNVPVKFPLTDVKGVLVSTAIAHLTLQMFSAGAPVGAPIDATPPGSADVGDLFRFDGSQYIYDLSTKPLSTGTWQVQVHLDDGTVHTVLIGLK